MGDVTDRLDIINLIHLYSHYWDENQFDDWLDLFTPDATVELPLGTKLEGRAGIRKLPEQHGQRLAAYQDAGGLSLQIRHLMTNVAVTDQTGTTAEVRAYALMPIAYDGKDLEFTTTVSYQGRMIKKDGAWRISYWSFTFDRPLEFRGAPG